LDTYLWTGGTLIPSQTYLPTIGATTSKFWIYHFSHCAVV
jgi:hypothetical protein